MDNKKDFENENEKPDVKEQFDRVAKSYDENRRKFIPCFDAFYADSAEFVAKSIGDAKRIVDLGAGTGILSKMFFCHFSNAHFSLFDISEKMLKIAKERFRECDNVSFKTVDYLDGFDEISGEISKSDLTCSALSIHHLKNSQKSELFFKLKNTMKSGAVFANFDQFCAESKSIEELYLSFWEKSILSSGLSCDEILSWRERKKLDRECSVCDQMKMLEAAGFKDVECIFKCQKFAVIIAKNEV